MTKFKKGCVAIVASLFAVSLLAGSAAAGGKGKGKWKKKEYKEWVEERSEYKKDWRDDIRESQSSDAGCDLPPGLAKQGKVPPGWAKKCNQHAYRKSTHTHSREYREYEHKRVPRRSEERKVEGEVDVGINVHIPFP